MEPAPTPHPGSSERVQRPLILCLFHISMKTEAEVQCISSQKSLFKVHHGGFKKYPCDLGQVHKQKYSTVNHLNFEMFKALQDIFATTANPLLGSALKKFYLAQLESDL